MGDQALSTLLNMGFGYEESTAALESCKKDVSEAVSYLTDPNRVSIPFGPQPEDKGMQPMEIEAFDVDDEEYPAHVLKDIKGRIYSENWSMTYKEGEALLTCITAAVKLSDKKSIDTNEDCKKFVFEVLPVAFTKLLTNTPVHDSELQDVIYNITSAYLVLAVSQLKQKLELTVLKTLTTIMDPRSEFNFKNRSKRSKHNTSPDVAYAQSPARTTFRDPYGWLASLINKFGTEGGFDVIMLHVIKYDTSTFLLSHVLSPWGKCVEYLVPDVVGPIFKDIMAKGIEVMRTMTVEDYKSKEIGLVCDLLVSMKLICTGCGNHFTMQDAKGMDEMRLQEIEKMLKTSHFNARMNALNETLRLVEETRDMHLKYPIDSSRLLEWLTEQRILMVALENNLHQTQYTAKLRKIAEFIGASLTQEDINQFWNLQEGRQPVVVENAHNILAAAAVHFEEKQANHLFNLITKSWVKGDAKGRQRLLTLLGKLGKLPLVLDQIWALIHLKDVGIEEIEQGLTLHLDLLNSPSNQEDNNATLQIVTKCVSDIKSREWVVPAMKYLVRILQNCLQSSSKLAKNILRDLQNRVSAVNLITDSLVSNYTSITDSYSDRIQSDAKCTDSQYTLTDCVLTHLKMLKLVLEHCSDYLQWCYVEAIWDCLTGPKAALMHCDECFEWFARAISDLDAATQTKLFEQRLLLLDPGTIRPLAFNCFKVYFEAINTREGKMKRWSADSFTVDSLKMTGLQFVWNVALQSRDDVVSRDAVSYLLRVSYSALSPKLKKDCTTLHNNFTKHCQHLLQECVESAASESNEESLKRTANILNITTDYILLAESTHRGVRLLEPHGSTYLGPLLTFNLEFDKDTNIKVYHHKNQKVSSVRLHAAKFSKASPDSIELKIADEVLTPGNDYKLLHRSQICEGSVIKVRVLPTASSPVKSWNEELNTPVKFEKQLPGVLLTMQPKVHQYIQVLSTMGPPVSDAVHRLLNQLPTNPLVHEKLENLESGKVKSPETLLRDLLTGPVTKITYNLEAISARIIPVEKDSSDRLALNTIFTNLTSELPGAEAVPRCGLDLFYDIFHIDSGVDPRSRRPSNMTLSELFLGEVKEEYLGVSQLTVSIFRGLLCGISSPLFKHNTPLNVTFLKKLAKNQLHTMMQFFTHIALTASFGSKLKSWGQPLPAQTSSTLNKISDAHSSLGCEAFEMVMLGATHHPHGMVVLFEIMEMPGGYRRMLLELLLYTPSSEVRSLVAEELQKLCLAQVSADDSSDEMDVDGCRDVPNVHHRLLQILLKTPLPIWGPSVHIRDAQKRLLSRCTQFFNLTSFLLAEMSLDSEVSRQLSINDLVKDEIKLLKAAACENGVDQAFIAGHLRLLCALASIKGVDQRQVGKKIIATLLDDFLFPAANIMSKGSGSKTRSRGLNDAQVFVNSEETQAAAYSLLVTLITDSPENSRDVTQNLVNLHHQPNQDLATEWNYIPMVQPRAECSLVGLKNGGATCYMNAVLQQLHATAEQSERILGLQPPALSSPTRSSQPKYGENMFLQFQHLLGNLSESQLKFYSPEGFWKAFKLWGQPINLHEQQDAFEFFNNLTDQVDDVLKARGEERVYQSQFGGEFVDQKICQECPHRSELAEPFMSLSVSTRTGNLDDSLEQFVKGELLEGDNAYLCEECDEKRTTLKRLCIKTLPKTLVIHLKRFDYDWERNKAFKFDNYFSFPSQLDMLPYTQVGVEGTDKQKRDVSSLYTLHGVIVHSGQANAGHYYSFIKKRGTGEWYKFNDDTVTSIKMTDQTMVEECFGGEFNSKGSTRNRYWNAYILFYDRVNEMSPPSPWRKPQKPISPTKRLKGSRLSISKLSDIPDNMENNDPVDALEELIKTGEKSGIFHEKLPPIVRNSIIETNTKLLKERAVFSESYFDFVRKLVITNIASPKVVEYTQWSTKLMCNFYLHTFLHVASSFQFHDEAWFETFRLLMETDVSAVATFLDFISSTRSHDYLTLHLVTCPRQNIRKKFATLIKTALDCLQKFEGKEVADTFISRYLCIITRELNENNKYCEQYFGILYHYSKISVECTLHLRSRNFVTLFVSFLVGSPEADHAPKWTSSQLQNFVSGYQTLSEILSLTCLSQFYSSETITINPLLSPVAEPNPPEPAQGIHAILSDVHMATNFLSHVLQVCHAVGHSSVSSILCILSWCNQPFTTCLISQMVAKLATVESHSLKPLFTLLLHLLALEDPYQLMRVEHVITGESGLLSLVRESSSEDPKRAYQCVKFLTQLLRSNPAAKEHILNHITDWQWSVNWLKTAFETEAKSSSVSNESASTKGFQRTASAQKTLVDATALLNEFESSQ